MSSTSRSYAVHMQCMLYWGSPATQLNGFATRLAWILAHVHTVPFKVSFKIALLTKYPEADVTGGFAAVKSSVVAISWGGVKLALANVARLARIPLAWTCAWKQLFVSKRQVQKRKRLEGCNLKKWKGDIATPHLHKSGVGLRCCSQNNILQEGFKV